MAVPLNAEITEVLPGVQMPDDYLVCVCDKAFFFHDAQSAEDFCEACHFTFEYVPFIGPTQGPLESTG